MKKIALFFSNHHRRLIQAMAALLYNANLPGFLKGKIYQGPLKQVCVPGLNCYSCPGAVGSCPLGSLQAAFNSFPSAFPMYVVGLLLLFGALLGRAICAFLCPFGLVQELLFKIPSPKLPKSVWTRRLSGLKYVVLVGMVFALPLYFLIQNGVVTPAFCKWLCPAGTLEGGIPLVSTRPDLRNLVGGLFSWKMGVLALVLASSVFIYRPFCRFLCPLGAIYSFFNRFALFGVRVDEQKCTHCGLCTKLCPMDVKRINDRECLRCGDCKKRCPHGAIASLGIWKQKKEETHREKKRRTHSGSFSRKRLRPGHASFARSGRAGNGGL